MNVKDILPTNIKLIKITDENIALLIHSETLQIYTIEDNELISFLEKFTTLSFENLIKYFSKEDIEAYKNILSDEINKSPVSTDWKLGDISATSYDTVVLPISAKCNLGCPYCFATIDGGYKFKNFDKDSIKSTIDFLVKEKKDATSLTSIIFFGGEPLLNFNCMEFTVRYIQDNYPEFIVGYSLTTNGTILNDKITKFFENNNVSVLVSVDGPDNQFNLRRYKNGRSSVADVLKNIEKLKELNINLELRATLINTNPYIYETFDFFEQLKLPFAIIFAYTSENKSHNLSIYNEESLGIIKQSFEKLTLYYKNKFIRKEDVFDNIMSNHFDTIRYRQKKHLPCGAGHGYITIMANGDIFSCPHFMNDKKYRMGNIYDINSLNSDYSSVIVDDILECKDCWNKNICLGHCVAQKISLGKSNLMSLPPNECELQKIITEYYIKLFYYAKKYQSKYFIE